MKCKYCGKSIEVAYKGYEYTLYKHTHRSDILSAWCDGEKWYDGKITGTSADPILEEEIIDRLLYKYGQKS